ncbi:MAG: response regulator transcription factor [Nitrospira sp.]|nr:response regulator transcription factor [Nitrospira sp.]
MPIRPAPRAARTILIADSELPTRMGLHTILAALPGLNVLFPVSSATELLTDAGRWRPDLVLMGTRFSDGDGIETCRALLSRCPDLRIVFVANAATAQLLLHTMQAGAMGFILKTFHPSRLSGVVTQVLAGKPAFDYDLMSTALKWMGQQAESPQGLAPHLSPRHQQILPLLSEGLTNKEIGAQLNLSEKTVKNYLADLFDRLHMSRRSQVAAWFINRTVQHIPPPYTSMAAETIRGRTRSRSLIQEELLHAHNSAY